MQLQPSDFKEGPSLRRRLIVAIITITGVTLVGFLLASLGQFEMPLAEKLNALHKGLLGTLGNLFYIGFGPKFAIFGTMVLTVIIGLVSRNIRTAATFAVTVAATWLPVVLLKMLVNRPRPDVTLLSLPFQPAPLDASYPSGHAAFITALVIALVSLITVRYWRTVAKMIGALIVIAAGFLLTVDGVHYPTDVIASIVWVLAVAPFVQLLWVRTIMPHIPLLNRR